MLEGVKRTVCASVCLLLLAVGCRSPARPERSAAARAAELASAPCSMKVHSRTGTDTFLVADGVEPCRSFALARAFGDPTDFVRLVAGSSRPALSSRAEAALLDPATEVAFRLVVPPDTLGGGPGPLSTPRLNSGRCETLQFFGVPLHCFNAVGEKAAHLADVIAPLLFLKSVDTHAVINPLLGTRVRPFEFLTQQRIEFADATDARAPSPAIAREFGRPVQCAPGVSAFLALRDGDALSRPSLVVATWPTRQDGLYRNPLPDDVRRIAMLCAPLENSGVEARIHRAAVYYHEANHVFGGHAHYLSDAPPVVRVGAPLVGPAGAAVGAYPGASRADNGVSCRNVLGLRLSQGQRARMVEPDLASVFGAHLTFLLDQASNPDLGSEERCAIAEEIDQLLVVRPRFCGNLSFTVPARCP